MTLIEDALKNPEINSFFDACKISLTGFVYCFVGKHSGKVFNVEISSDEIRKIIQTPENLNIQ